MTEAIVNCYPFLKEIPKEDFVRLGLNVLEVLDKFEHKLLSELSSKLQKNLVVYNKLRMPDGYHLCRYLESAGLNDDELRTLHDTEALLSPEKVIVAYNAPLSWRPIMSEPIDHDRSRNTKCSQNQPAA